MEKWLSIFSREEVDDLLVASTFISCCFLDLCAAVRAVLVWWSISSRTLFQLLTILGCFILSLVDDLHQALSTEGAAAVVQDKRRSKL
jgi:hypothetical protein